MDTVCRDALPVAPHAEPRGAVCSCDRTPRWPGAQHRRGPPRVSMRTERLFNSARAFLDRWLGRAACLAAKLQSHTPPSSRSTQTRSLPRSGSRRWASQRGTSASPLAAGCIPATRARRGRREAARRIQLDTAVHERAAGTLRRACPGRAAVGPRDILAQESRHALPARGPSMKCGRNTILRKCESSKELARATPGCCESSVFCSICYRLVTHFADALLWHSRSGVGRACH